MNVQEHFFPIIAEYEQDGLIDSYVAERARQVCHYFQNGQQWPDIMPDDGGVCFYMKACKASVEIDVLEETGEFWFRARNEYGEIIADGLQDKLPLYGLPEALQNYSDYVDRAKAERLS